MEWLLVDLKIAICGPPNSDGSSSVPTFTITGGRPGRRVVRCVPQVAQNSRVTGFSRSLRLNVFGAPFV